MRPAFRVDVACGPALLTTTIEEHLRENQEGIEGGLSARHGVLHVSEDSRRFWTPCLELTIEGHDEPALGPNLPRAQLWGTFSPRPEIWTGFVFAIGTLVVLSLFSSIFGLAQLLLNQAPVALWVPFVAALLGMLLYASALIGQGLSIAEMYRIRAFIDDCIRDAEAVAGGRSSEAPPDFS